MRAYVWVVVIIFGLMGAYLALLPGGAWSEAGKAGATASPF